MSTGGQGGKTGGVFDWAANAMQGAGGALKKSASMYGSPGLSPNAAGYQASTAALPANISSGMAGYMNPYTDEVINNSMLDINKLNKMQLDQLGAKATMSGAFGGDRHGLMEAETNIGSQKTMGDLASKLRMAGFDTAAGLSSQDILNKMTGNMFNVGQVNQAKGTNAAADNAMAVAAAQDKLAKAGGLGSIGGLASALGGQGFNIGQSINNQQMQQGTLQQSLIQKIMDQAGGQFQGFTGKPTDMVSMVMQALGMSPLNNNVTQTSTSTPGLFDYLSLASQMFGGWKGSQPG